jgi:uncharacterized protein YbbC (DUF1343 family)
VIGAPYIDDVRLAAQMNRLKLPGVRFIPIRFTPDASVHKDVECGGLNIVVTDRDVCEIVNVGLALAQTIHRLHPEDFEPQMEKMHRLLLHRQTLEQLRTETPLQNIRADWQVNHYEFMQRRERYLLY